MVSIRKLVMFPPWFPMRFTNSVGGVHVTTLVSAGRVNCPYPDAGRAGVGGRLLLPQNRAAYFSDEAIVLAVVGLAAGAHATLDITPATVGVHPVTLTATGDGSTLVYTLPPLALMPGDYNLSLDGNPAGN